MANFDGFLIPNTPTGTPVQSYDGQSGIVLKTQIPPTVAVAQAVYRGWLGGVFVYSVGAPPGGGATGIVIVGYED